LAVDAGVAPPGAQRIPAARARAAALHGAPRARRPRRGRARTDGGAHRGSRAGSVHGGERFVDAGGPEGPPRPTRGGIARVADDLQVVREGNMKTTLDHIGIAVKDLATALAFYRDALGLEIEGTEDVDSQNVRAHFAPVGEARLELLEATAPESP